MPFYAYGLVRYSLKIDFFLLLQMQHRHEDSYHVVAVEGIHPDEFFVFETKLRKHILEIESGLQNPTPTIITVNRLGDTTFSARNQIFHWA
jgi:hypothetical protein